MQRAMDYEEAFLKQKHSLLSSIQTIHSWWLIFTTDMTPVGVTQETHIRMSLWEHFQKGPTKEEHLQYVWHHPTE